MPCNNAALVRAHGSGLHTLQLRLNSSSHLCSGCWSGTWGNSIQSCTASLALPVLSNLAGCPRRQQPLSCAGVGHAPVHTSVSGHTIPALPARRVLASPSSDWRSHWNSHAHLTRGVTLRFHSAHTSLPLLTGPVTGPALLDRPPMGQPHCTCNFPPSMQNQKLPLGGHTADLMKPHTTEHGSTTQRARNTMCFLAGKHHTRTPLTAAAPGRQQLPGCTPPGQPHQPRCSWRGRCRWPLRWHRLVQGRRRGRLHCPWAAQSRRCR